MKLIRIKVGEQIHYGSLLDGKVELMKGDLSESLDPLGIIKEIEQIELLAPVVPSKVICVGLNYKDHAREMGMELPKEPIIFLKPPTTVLDPGKPIELPALSKQVDYEAELAIVIKKQGKYIPRSEAKDFILGYTCANDVTARDIQKIDGQWTRAKAFDTFLPLGPFIETKLEVENLTIKAILNGEIKQSSNTNEMIFSVDYMISYISQVMTLYPGDVILTGTPPGIGPMKSGDEIVIEIEGLGLLRNPVA